MGAILVSIAIGMSMVLQGGTNRLISEKYGLTSAIFLNNVLIVCLSGAVWFIFAGPSSVSDFKWGWWMLVPALCGLSIVTGIPWSISQIGATRTFLCLVAGQMALSAIWDVYVDDVGLNPYRIAGAGLALAGVAVANFR